MREELRRTQEEFQILKDSIQIYHKYHKQLLQERDEQLLHNRQSIQKTKQLVASTSANYTDHSLSNNCIYFSKRCVYRTR